MERDADKFSKFSGFIRNLFREDSGIVRHFFSLRSPKDRRVDVGGSSNAGISGYMIGLNDNDVWGHS